MKTIGLDIGTTTICAIVLDTITCDVLKTVTYDNDAGLDGTFDFERIQSPARILDKCAIIIAELVKTFSPIACIGITGQMHGILYLDRLGNALSPLYFWQDESGNQPFDEKQSYAERLTDITGYRMATGFGATTYYYHSQTGRVPQTSSRICTIHDYVAMKLCGKNEPLVHTSDAASFGLFNLDTLMFDQEAIVKAGLDINIFPRTTKGFAIAGMYDNQIPISVAIGDNQASFLGSVCDMENCVLVNVGTGSQISFLSDSPTVTEGMESRPCFDNKYLCVGSSLCGGRAFALLEQFLRNTASFVTDSLINTAYPAIDRYLENSHQPDNPLIVSTRFSGTRNNPEERGGISNLGLSNFTPQQLIWGVLNGMVEELHAMYKSAKLQTHKVLIGSGNGLRKNKALQKLFRKNFGMELIIPAHSEEAAFGAALFALTAAGYEDSIFSAQKLIRYSLQQSSLEGV